MTCSDGEKDGRRQPLPLLGLRQSMLTTRDGAAGDTRPERTSL